MANSTHQIIRDLLNGSGNDFLAEMRLYNMLVDFDYFRNCGTSKMAFREVISKGYVHTVLDYHRGNANKHAIFSFISDLETNHTKQAISYALQCMFYGLGVIDDVETYDNVCNYAWLERLEGQRDQHIEVDLWNSEFAVINVEPAEALVSVDGHILKLKDGTIAQEFNVGDHLLEVSAANHHPYRGTISVKADDTSTVSIRLVPMFGKLLVMANAKNAVVFVDGKEFGPVPTVITPLPSGRHEIILKDPLYKDYREFIEIHDDEKLQLNITMEGNSGTVSFKNSSPEISIFVDGIHLGKGDWNGPLAAGRHKVECARHSFFTKTIYIDVEPNKLNHIVLPELEAYYGCLKVNVFPVGAKILLDGEYIGNSPLKYKNAYIGRHTVTIYEEECGNKIEKQVDIQEGKITTIEDELPHTFLRDFSQLRIGDFYYADGTFAHERSSIKEAIAIVFTLETTEEEKRHGWTHGQIMAIKDAEKGKAYSWNKTKKIEPDIKSYESCKPWHKGEVDQRPAALLDKDGFIYSTKSSISGREEFEAYYAAKEYSPKLDETNTSGWYLPSIGQWNDFVRNILNITVSLDGMSTEQFMKTDTLSILDSLDINDTFSNDFWAATQCGRDFAWHINFDPRKRKVHLGGFQKQVSMSVRPVAAI